MRTVILKYFLFTMGMLVVRAYLTGHYSFFFLLWNLFLAWLPLWMIKKAAASQHKIYKPVLFLCGILFLPNAPYIVTDLFHLTKNLVAPLWFDTILIFNFSLFGLICFVEACSQLFRNLLMPKFWFSAVKMTIFFLCGYGIYLGRYLRFNSWDVLSSPFDLMTKMYLSVFAPGHAKETIGFSITFAVFLYLIFELYQLFSISRLSNELHQKERSGN